MLSGYPWKIISPLLGLRSYWKVSGDMIVDLIESDVPRTFKYKLAEYLARPPQPVLRFYGLHSWEGNALKFQVRNGLPLPVLYGIYVEADGDYREVTDHIGPFSTDRWKVVFDQRPSKASIKLGLVPFEIQADKLEVS